MHGRNSVKTAEAEMLDLRTAAELAGFTTRQFRQIIEEDRIATTNVDGHTFVSAIAFEAWKTTK